MVTDFECEQARRKQFQDHIEDFINQNLGPFPFDPVELQNLAEKAAKAAKQIQEEYNLEPEEVLQLANVALYDIVILCGPFFSAVFVIA